MQSVEEIRPSFAKRALSGTVLLVIGLIMLFFAWGYPVGSVQDMGPGYIPRVVGLVICGLALAIIVADTRSPTLERAGQMHWRGLIFVSAAITIFAVFVDILGLIPSIFMAVSVSMFADDKARPLTVLIYSIIATFAGWLLFLVGLELPIPAFWR